ncbi:hypothetical protein ACFWFB_32720, partial [Streptomyces albidoflavus]
MSDEIRVRVTLDSFDLLHPSDKQTQVYVQVPEVARASWLLPADHFHFSKSEPWPSVVDSAQEHYAQTFTVTDSASAAARDAVIEWLSHDENHDAMRAAWELDQARRHPVARKLLAENERLRARVVELEAATSGAFLAMHGGRVLGLYRDEADALHHCEEAVGRSDYRSCPISWRKAPSGTCELFAWTYRDVESRTGLTVSPIEVRPEFDEGWGADGDEFVAAAADRLTALLAPTQTLT